MLGSITCTVDASLAGPEKSRALSPLVPIYCNTKHKLSKSYWLDHQTKHALSQHYLSIFWQEDHDFGFSPITIASCVILMISYKIMINSPHAMLAYFRGFPACFTRHASTCLLHPLWSIPQVSAWQLPCPTRSGFPVRVQPLVSHSDCKHPHKNECTQE